MAEGNNFNHTPKRFTRGHSEPSRINKFNYTGGCWNSPMPYNASCAIDASTGRTSHPTNNLGVEKYNTFYSGWLYYIPERLPGNTLGKRFQLDFAWFAGSGYYDGTGNSNLYIDVSFYSEISRSWSGWRRLSGTYGAPPTYSIAVGSGRAYVDDVCYQYRGFRGDSYQPLCGYNPHLTSSILSATGGRTFGSYVQLYNFLTGRGLRPSSWDGSHVSFLAAPPVGVRYMSLNGNWDDSSGYVSSAATGVYRNGSAAGSKTSSSLDGGNNTGRTPLLSFYIDENFIRGTCGTVAGVTKFRLRFWKNSGDSYWDWPANGMDQWMALDNPRVGLLDWGPKGAGPDWPPRYDARAWYRNRSAAIQQPELMVQYCPRNSSNWQIN